ncbi:MAG: hypothetical protein ACYTHM_22155, partial [Planctomycetota bacterium]
MVVRKRVWTAAFPGLVLLLACPVLRGQTSDPSGWKTTPLDPRLFEPDKGFITLDASLSKRVWDGEVEVYGKKIFVRPETKGKVTGAVVQVGKTTTIHDRFPFFVGLAVSGNRRGVYVYPWPDEEYAAVSAYGVRFVLDGEEFFCIDANMNGVIGEEGEDGLAGPNCRLFTSFQGVAWSTRGRYKVRFERKGRHLLIHTRKWKLTFTEDGRVLSCWRVLNALRARAGSAGVGWDEGMVKDCLLHAKYCNMPDILEHEEEP